MLLCVFKDIAISCCDFLKQFLTCYPSNHLAGSILGERRYSSYGDLTTISLTIISEKQPCCFKHNILPEDRGVLGTLGYLFGCGGPELPESPHGRAVSERDG